MAPSSEAEDEVGRVFREESGRAVATLIRVLGDIDVAEDAVQDAFAIAVATWPATGTPPNPAAWIVTTGRNRAIDRLRRESLGRSLLGDLVREHAERGSSPVAPHLEPLDDDQLRLIFTCCHPALASEAQVALTLRLLGGLTTREVARAFLLEEATMAQRLVRAKHKIRAAHIPYRVPEGDELPARLPPVLAVCYLVYNAGAGRPPGGDATGSTGAGDLAAEAIRLARLLVELMPGQPEVLGLLALLLFSESRRATRFDADGALVLLRDQARDRWDSACVTEARALLNDCMRLGAAGAYQLQAAIQAVHSEASAASETDWTKILALYDELLRRTGSPVVALNRAVALAEVEGAAAALEEVERLDLAGYYPLHATRGELLERLDRRSEAAVAFARAAELAATEAERDFLAGRAAACEST